MAVVNSSMEEDQNNPSKVTGGVTAISEAPSGGNVKGVSQGAQQTSVNTATPSAGSATPTTTGFTNINDYLTANQGGSNNLGQRVTGAIDTATQQGTGGIQSAGTNFGAAVNTGTDTYNPSLTKTATADPTAFLKSPEYDNLVTMLSGKYSGPSDWGTSSQAGQASQAENTAEQTAQLGQTSGGRSQLLQKTSSSPYTGGQVGLNEFLLENNPTSLNPVLDASQKGSNLEGVYQQVAQTGGNEVTAGQNTSAATGVSSKNDILNAQGSLQTTLGGQATTAQKTASDNYTALSNALSGTTPPGTKNTQPVTQGPTTQSVAPGTRQIQQSVGPQVRPSAATTTPTLSAAQLAQLGITSDQWNQLTALNAQAQAQGLPGINYATYLTAPDTSQLTAASQATPKQISDWNALNQLVPGSNQQLLAGATGTPGSANPAFNLSDAMAAINAQMQAKTTQPSGVTPPVAPASSGVSNGAIAAIAGSNALGSLLGNVAKPVISNLVKGGATTPTDANAAASAADLANGGSGIVATGPPTQVWTDPTTGYTYNLPADTTGAATSAAGGSALSDTGASSTVWTDPTTGYTYNLPADTSGAASDAAAEGGDTAAGSSGALGNVMQGVAVVGAVLATYNAIANWQSGDTGGNTVRGAEAGAAIGTAVLPGIGTVIGGAIGAVVGAISSLFGSGKVGAATTDWHNVTNAGAAAQIANPATGDQAWSEAFKGMMDTGNNIFSGGGSDRHKNPDVLATLISQQVVNGFKTGAVPLNATSQQVYDKVIVPWMQSAAGAKAGINWGNLKNETIQQEMFKSVVDRYMAGDAITRGDMGVYGNQGTKTASFKSLVPNFAGSVTPVPLPPPPSTSSNQPIRQGGGFRQQR